MAVNGSRYVGPADPGVGGGEMAAQLARATRSWTVGGWASGGGGGVR